MIERCVNRVVLGPTAIEMTLRHADRSAGTDTITVPWSRAGIRRQREVLLPEGGTVDRRPIRAETRATLIRSIALGRRWLGELVAGSTSGSEAIAIREGCSQRHVNMMLSLAFLAPDLVRAAVDGQLPRGVGVSRLFDAPIEWSRQWSLIGLQRSPEARY